MKHIWIILSVLICSLVSGASLKDLEIEIAAHKDYKDLSRNGWETKILYRQAQRLYPEDLQRNIDNYVEKITRGREVMVDNPTQHDREYWEKALPRLIDKLAVCRKEQALRKEGVIRSMHHTAYYIDYVNGLDANTGLSTAQAWKTITKYTTTTVRTAGDIAYLRANTTWPQGTLAVDIVFDESGTVDSYIKIIGCDATTNDPWNDDSDVKPIVDFEDAAYEFVFSTDDFWQIERLIVKQSIDTNGSIYVYRSFGFRLINCDLSDSTTRGLSVSLGSHNCRVEGCTFQDFSEELVGAVDSRVTGLYFKDCVFDAGSGIGSARAVTYSGDTYFENCTFGLTNTYNTAALVANYSGKVFLRNCQYSGTLIATYAEPILFLYSEDDDGVFEAHKTVLTEGVIDRDTLTVRSGGADSSAKLTPNSSCGPNAPLQLGDPMSGFAHVWATADQQINISIYACVDTAWDSALTAAETYATFSYLSNGASAARTEVQSTETIANDESWTAFTSGNITPLQTGWVYIWFHVAEFEDASEAVLVDIKPEKN